MILFPRDREKIPATMNSRPITVTATRGISVMNDSAAEADDVDVPVAGDVTPVAEFVTGAPAGVFGVNSFPINVSIVCIGDVKSPDSVGAGATVSGIIFMDWVFAPNRLSSQEMPLESLALAPFTSAAGAAVTFAILAPGLAAA